MSPARYVPRMIAVVAVRLGDGRVVVVHPDNSVKLVAEDDFDAAFMPEAPLGVAEPSATIVHRRRRKVRPRGRTRTRRAAPTNRSTAVPAAPHLRPAREPKPVETPTRRPGRPRRRIEDGAAELEDRDERRELDLSHPNRHDHDADITSGLDAQALAVHGSVDPTRPHRKVCGYCAYTSKLSAAVCRRPTCQRPFPASSIRPDPE